MSRSLVPLTLALALLACDGEDEAVDETVANEAGTAAVGSGVATAPHVANAGAACGLDAACRGAMAECMTRSSTLSNYAGGYCTASCTTHADCGLGGHCPVGEAERANPGYDFVGSWPRKCFALCTPGPNSGCRPGYRCESLAGAYNRRTAPAPMHQPVCIPGTASGNADGGTHPAETKPSLPTRDAGRASLRSDAGPSEATQATQTIAGTGDARGLDGGL